MQPLRFKPIGQVYQALSGSASPGAGSSPSSCLFFTIVGTNGAASIRWRRVHAADSGRRTHPASTYERPVRAPPRSSPAISGPCTIVVGRPPGSTWHAASYEYTGLCKPLRLGENLSIDCISFFLSVARQARIARIASDSTLGGSGSRIEARRTDPSSSHISKRSGRKHQTNYQESIRKPVASLLTIVSN